MSLVLFLAHDQQGDIGHDVEDNDQKLIQAEEGIKRDVEDLPRHIEELPLRSVNKIRCRDNHKGGDQKQNDIDDAAPFEKFCNLPNIHNFSPSAEGVRSFYIERCIIAYFGCFVVEGWPGER